MPDQCNHTILGFNHSMLAVQVPVYILRTELQGGAILWRDDDITGNEIYDWFLASLHSTSTRPAASRMSDTSTGTLVTLGFVRTDVERQLRLCGESFMRCDLEYRYENSLVSRLTDLRPLREYVSTADGHCHFRAVHLNTRLNVFNCPNNQCTIVKIRATA